MTMTQRERFRDKVMIVTGAAQGIGRGVALAAAREGARLVLADRSDLVDQVALEARDLKAQVSVA
ncbi:SDR family NAD(P)-dependent oxidoreductase, partial [Massilia niastensis]|uniref:SDR family NAD(P)-dependent oxidoreductase n=1 Tax=Massilia niastensis TaxID=544911 RepID=UPI003530A167